MPVYVVSAEVTISMYTEVEADSPEKALEIAEGRDIKRLCIHCSGDDDKREEWVTSGELDGSPTKMKVDGEVEDE